MPNEVLDKLVLSRSSPGRDTGGRPTRDEAQCRFRSLSPTIPR